VCPVHSTVHIRAYTHSQRTPHNSTDKQHSTDTNGAQHTDCRCAESPIVIFQPPDKLQRQSDALLVIYEPKHTKSAICAFTRMHTNQPKREERQHLLYGVDVYVPLRSDVAKPVPSSHLVCICALQTVQCRHEPVRKVRLREKGMISPDDLKRCIDL